MNEYTRSNAHTQILRTVKDFSRILSSWTRAHRADVHFNKHQHDLFQVPCGVCFQWFVPERSPSYPWSWTRHRRNGVRFPKYPHGCASRLRYSGPTFHFWTRWLVSWVVELGLTGPTSISTNISTTCSKSLAVFVSNDSSLSVRPRILNLIFL